MAVKEQMGYPNMDDLEIQELLAMPVMRKGRRNGAILDILNAAGKSGWSNHQILKLGSELAVRWGVSSPDRNLYDHWFRLLAMLRNVRSHYPDPSHPNSWRT
jgi:hypothetical protein